MVLEWKCGRIFRVCSFTLLILWNMKKEKRESAMEREAVHVLRRSIFRMQSTKSTLKVQSAKPAAHIIQQRHIILQ